MKELLKDKIKNYSSIYSLFRIAYSLLSIFGSLLEKIQYKFLKVTTKLIYRNYDRKRNLYLIDVTKTAYGDLGTGIQRIVRNLTIELYSIDKRFVPVRITTGSKEIIWAVKWMRKNLRLSIKEIWRYSLSIPKFDYVKKYIILDALWHREDILRKKIFPLLKICQTPVVTVIYDIIPISHSRFCSEAHVQSFSRFFKSAIAYSEKILCISKSVEKNVKDYLKSSQFNYRLLDISSWPLGFEFDAKNAIGKRDKHVNDVKGCSNYLMVGTINNHKGYDIVIKSFKELWKSGINANLCIVGKPGWDNCYFEENILSVNTANLLYFGQLDDESLDVLYQNSKCLIQASYIEGYGLPIVEAASRGLGLIVSDIPIFREVTNNQAIFFDVGDSNQLYAIIRDIEEANRDISNTSCFKMHSWYESAYQFRSQTM